MQAALQSDSAMVRYWAAMACTAFGEQAQSLAPLAMPLLSDKEDIVRVRAAEFLGRIGKINPQVPLTKVVNATDDPILATEALNSVVWFKDFFGDRYPVKRSDFDRSSEGADVEDRVELHQRCSVSAQKAKRRQQEKESRVAPDDDGC